MAQGLEVFNENGDTIINTSTQTTSILGNISISGAGTYTVTDSRFSLGNPFFLSDEFYNGVNVVGIVSGTTYTFTVTVLQQGTYNPFRIIYGVY